MLCRRLLIPLLAAGLCGCQSTPPSFRLDDAVAERRDVQSRAFVDADRATVMRVATDALRDLGFTVVALEDDLGLIGASKQTDVSQPRNTVLQVGLLLLTGIEYAMPKRELLALSMTVSDQDAPTVYAACQRTVFDDVGTPMLDKSGLIEQPEFYARIFDAMTTALFLENEL